MKKNCILGKYYARNITLPFSAITVTPGRTYETY